MSIQSGSFRLYFHNRDGITRKVAPWTIVHGATVGGEPGENTLRSTKRRAQQGSPGISNFNLRTVYP
ncbi:hypothetical protein CTRI78_v006790 [Colletotrichum trifolii]|uniref:Uncharacterized protein n=1 Tax=Colletotrichum trifolii TaxID=5466 RepID=A0A4R8RI04_COLTR|nr:hypothetical protein CTRI78_v006790 [Colletotrichum trifolii]